MFLTVTITLIVLYRTVGFHFGKLVTLYNNLEFMKLFLLTILVNESFKKTQKDHVKSFLDNVGPGYWVFSYRSRALSLCKLSNYCKMSKNHYYKSSHPEVLLVKGVLKMCSIFTGQHLCRSVISFSVAKCDRYYNV